MKVVSSLENYMYSTYSMLFLYNLVYFLCICQQCVYNFLVKLRDIYKLESSARAQSLRCFVKTKKVLKLQTCRVGSYINMLAHTNALKIDLNYFFGSFS